MRIEEAIKTKSKRVNIYIPEDVDAALNTLVKEIKKSGQQTSKSFLITSAVLYFLGSCKRVEEAKNKKETL